MRKYRVLYKSTTPATRATHVESESKEEAKQIVNKYYGKAISAEEVLPCDNTCVTPCEIFTLLDKMYKYYDETCSTEQRKRVDAIRRFYAHLLALDEISEEYIREIVE